MPRSSRSRRASSTLPRRGGPVQQGQRPPRQGREGAGRPAAKLAKLSETVDKLRAAQASATTAAAAPAPAKEVDRLDTAAGCRRACGTARLRLPPKPEVARLPTVEGWVLRDVSNGSALIEGRRGLYEVYAGDPVPGLGRVDAIRRQDGRWVVVTTKGLIVAR